MFWYGWILYGLLVAAVAGAIAWLLPARVTDRFWQHAVWLVPLACIAYMAWEGRHWFTFTFPEAAAGE
jgi:hypothetical protein